MKNLKLYSSSLLLITCLFILPLTANTQDIDYARKMVDTLASPSMHGRGYVLNGSNKAGDYLANEMSSLGLQFFGKGYKQEFPVDVITYPSTVRLIIDKKELRAGYEFTVVTGSPSVLGTFRLHYIDSSSFKRNGSLKKYKETPGRSFIVYDPSLMKGKHRRMADSLLKHNFVNCAGFILLSDKPSIVWSVMARGGEFKYPVINVLTSAIAGKGKDAAIVIERKTLDNYNICNVTGYVKGTSQPDSFVVVTAHYDHLGMLGPKVYYPGANDNASGTAMMMDMARYYSDTAHKPAHSMVFIAFAGEEIGLKGSFFAAENPLFPLKNIKFLINLDMVGTGSEGITMVNAVQLPAYFEKMEKLNADKEYVLKVAKRGESCNSDHCPFYQKGVPAVFIYSMGKEHTEYHNPYDTAEKVPFTEYEDIFRLIRDFMDSL